MSIQRRVSKLETTTGAKEPPRDSEFTREKILSFRESLLALANNLSGRTDFNLDEELEAAGLQSSMLLEPVPIEDLPVHDLRHDQLEEARQMHARRLKRDDGVERGSFPSAGEAEEENGEGIDWSEAGTLARSSQLPEELRRVIVRGRGK